MSARFNSDGWTPEANTDPERGARSVAIEDVSMREKWNAVRDTLIVLGLQIVFRVVMALRSWNY